MNATKRQLKAQFDRAVSLGWLAHFEEAANTITKGYFDTADLMAIGSRETNLDPKWLKKPGDGGHGFGLMQIDIRSFPEFTASPDWKDAKKGIMYGARVLMQKWHDYEQNIGKRVRVKSYTYTGKPASGATAQHIVISGYNCGRWSQYAFANGQPIDKYSTGHDYGTDVMERAAIFRSFLRSISAATSSAADDARPSAVEHDTAGTTAPAGGDVPSSNELPPTKITETETVKVNDQGQAEASVETTTETFVPKNIPAFIPRFGKQWFLSLIPGAGLISTWASYLAGLPPWFIYVLGILTGIAMVLFFQLLMRHRTDVHEFLRFCYGKIADPNSDNLIPTSPAGKIGKRSGEIISVLTATEETV